MAPMISPELNLNTRGGGVLMDSFPGTNSDNVSGVVASASRIPRATPALLGSTSNLIRPSGGYMPPASSEVTRHSMPRLRNWLAAKPAIVVLGNVFNTMALVGSMRPNLTTPGPPPQRTVSTHSSVARSPRALLAAGHRSRLRQGSDELRRAMRPRPSPPSLCTWRPRDRLCRRPDWDR